MTLPVARPLVAVATRLPLAIDLRAIPEEAVVEAGTPLGTAIPAEEEGEVNAAWAAGWMANTL